MKITFSDKLIAYLTLASGLSISAVAVWYSVAGLVSIFAAAAVPIIIMGIALEISKLVATVWLKMNWKIAPVLMRTYLIIAIIILMFITSMGIFGFLSKAHLDQAVPTGDVQDKVILLDEKIKTQQDNVDAARKALKQMDAQVDEKLARTTDDKGAERAVQIRRSQSKERNSLQNDIGKAQKEIAQLKEQRAPVAKELRKVEAEVGPIKYIAALIYGDNPDQNILEKAVRAVIIIIVAVFDPLAVVLLLASQYSFQWFRRVREEDVNREGWHQEWVPNSEAWPEWEADDGPLTKEQVDEINKQAGVSDVNMTERLFDSEEEFFEHGKEIAKELDQQEEDRKSFDFSKHAYLLKPWAWGTKETVGPQVTTPVSNLEEGEEIINIDNEDADNDFVVVNEEPPKADFAADEYYDYLDGQPELEESDIIEAAEPNEKAAMHRWKEEHPNSSLKLQRKLLDKGVIKELPWHQYLRPQPDFTEEDESKKKDIDLDGNSGRTSGNKEQRIVADTYIQNAEQGNETLWQRIKKGDE